MIKLLFALVLIVIAVVVGDHELIRYKKSLEICKKQRTFDQNLIMSPNCMDAALRTSVCSDAEHRTIFTVEQCARNHWRVNSKWAEIWNTFTGDYWSMLWVVLPTILGFMYFAFGTWRESLREDRYYQRQNEFVDRFYQQIDSKPNVFQIEGRKRKRFKRERKKEYDAEWYKA